jgi:serine/threonine-protein kinase
MADNTTHSTPPNGSLRSDDHTRSLPPNDSTPAAASTSADAADLPEQVGRYRIEGEIARGGMGIVLRAIDQDFGRTLAVKVLLDHRRGDEAAVRRFLDEARLCGQLQHPGIPPVHEMGTLPDGRPFFAMKLVKGDTLAALLDRRASTSEDLPRWLAVFEQVCQTVAYAHSRGVLHRDLKPANVMVGAFGEVQVMDWGLAKVLSERPGPAPAATAAASTLFTLRGPGSPEETAPGSILGTPAFMPPEQARGQTGHLDQRADVFALGGILCAILTGRPPYAGEGPVLKQAQQGDLTQARARLTGSRADGELVRLALACVEFEPAKRPRDAGAVAEAVAEHRAAVEERARKAQLERAAAEARAEEAKATVRAERRARRRALALAAAVLVIVVGSAAAGLWAVHRQAELAREVDTALAEAALLQGQGNWHEALSAARRAEALLAGGGPAALRRRALQVRQDLEMVVQLEAIRLPQENDAGGMIDTDRADAAYARAFRAYGLDVAELEPADAAERIAASAVRPQLVAALEDWSSMKRKDPQGKAHLLAAARLADPDEYRNRLRDAMHKGDKAALEELARGPEVASLSVPSLVLLAATLRELRSFDLAVAVLRPAQQQNPGDFWLNNDLALCLERMDPPRLNEAAAYYRAALAARPHSPYVRMNLGRILRQLGNLTEAEALYRQALGQIPDDADAYYYLGIALHHQGKYDEAVAAYRRSIQLEPGSAMAHNNLGATLLLQGKPEEAEPVLRKALELRPDFGMALSNLGHLLHKKGDLVGAEAKCRRATELEPDNGSAHYNLGLVLEQVGRWPEAETAFRRSAELRPEEAEVRNHLGVALAQQGKVEEAEAEFRELIRRKPGLAPAHVNLGNIHEQKGKHADAEACFRAAMKQQPDLPEAHFGLGLALQSQEKHPEAVASFRRALDLKLEHSLAHSRLGFSLLALGQHAEAEGAYRKALTLKPKDPESWFHLGACLEALDKHAEAADAFRKLIDLKPDDAVGYAKLGGVLAGQGKPAEAAAAYRKAIERQPDDGALYIHLGNALSAAKQDAEAEAAYRKALEHKQDAAEVHYNLGNALWHQGKRDEAAAAFRRAVSRKPDYADALDNLGGVLQELNQVDEAIVAHRAAIRARPGHANAHYNLGVALKTKGLLPEAVASFRKAVELKPDLVMAYDQLGIALLEQRKYADAVPVLRKAVKLKPDEAGYHCNLGVALTGWGKYDEAVKAHRKAIELDRRSGRYYFNLGVALQYGDKLDDAAAAYRKSIELRPASANAHHNLGTVLRDQKKWPQAEASFRRSLELADDFDCRINLAYALSEQGKREEAIAEYRRAIQIKDDDPDAHYNLGLLLAGQGKYAEAEACFRKVVALNPDGPDAHCDLGQVLKIQGRFAEALAAFRRGHELGSRDPKWSRPSAEWMREAERMLALDAKLPDVLAGKVKPAGAAECLELGKLCQGPKKLYAVAARFFADAFAIEPKCAADLRAAHRYNAACSAALAAAGQGEDATDLADKERARLRKQALAWLRADLDAWAKLVDGGKAADRQAAQGQMRHWQGDADLSGVRHPWSLLRLPGDERRQWQKLWADVDDLLKKASKAGR